MGDHLVSHCICIGTGWCEWAVRVGMTAIDSHIHHALASSYRSGDTVTS